MFAYRHSSEGSDHARTGAGNQDACLVAACGDALLMFLADGMTSARFGARAARLCVDAGSRSACAAFVPHAGMAAFTARCAVRAAFAAAFNELQKDAGPQRPLSELSCTFMCAVFDRASGALYFGFCGDGGIVARGLEGPARLAAAPQKGENFYQTSSVLEPDAWEFGEMEGVVSVLAATDGVLDCLCGFSAQAAGVVPNAAADALLALAESASAPGGDEGAARACVDALIAGAASGERVGLDAVEACGLAIGASLFAGVTDDKTLVLASAAPAPRDAERRGAPCLVRDAMGQGGIFDRPMNTAGASDAMRAHGAGDASGAAGVMGASDATGAYGATGMGSAAGTGVEARTDGAIGTLHATTCVTEPAFSDAACGDGAQRGWSRFIPVVPAGAGSARRGGASGRIRKARKAGRS